MWWWETEPMENFDLGNGISALAIMKKIDKLPPLHKYVSYGKISNYKPPSLSKVWVSGFLSVDRNRILMSAIMKKIKIWPPFCKYASYGKISNY